MATPFQDSYQSFLNQQNSFGAQNTGFGMNQNLTVNPNTGTFGSGNNFGGSNQSGFFSQDSAFGTRNNVGWFTGGAAAVSGLVGAYTGLEQLSLAKKSYKTDKAFADVNLANQAKTTNAELEDRQKARLASQSATNAPDVYESLGSYLDKNRVSGTV